MNIIAIFSDFYKFWIDKYTWAYLPNSSKLSKISWIFLNPNTFHFRNGYGIVRKRKRKYPHQQHDLSSNQSSVESIDTDSVCIAGKRKLISLETKRFVAIAQLQQRLRRAERPISERGSNLVEIPTFETAAENDFERISNAPKNITYVKHKKKIKK